MNYPIRILIIDTPQLIGYLAPAFFAGFILSLLISIPIGMLIGIKIKRLPRYARIAVSNAEVMENTINALNREIADSKARNSFFEADKLRQGFMIDEAVMLLNKAKGE